MTCNGKTFSFSHLTKNGQVWVDAESEEAVKLCLNNALDMKARLERGKYYSKNTKPIERKIEIFDVNSTN
jgi:hypothetical protein